MYVLDSIHTASAGPFVQTHHILGIVVSDGLEVAELSFPGLFVGEKIRGLYVNNLVTFAPHEVYFLSTCLLPRENLVMLLFVTYLEGMKTIYVDTPYFVDEISVLQGFQVVDDLQGGDVDMLRLEITADVVGGE